MKKKQADFQKTKLKVGKTLPKGTNVTNTAFQSKKIITRDKSRAADPKNPALSDLLKLLSDGNVRVKADALQGLSKYIQKNKDKLPMFFPDILKLLGQCLMDYNDKITEAAVHVLDLCFNHLNDIQIRPFFPSIALYVNCMMTHNEPHVKHRSLKLLDKLLGSHPAVACFPSSVLEKLLNLMSVTDRKGRKRPLDAPNGKITAEDWRMQVLTCMLHFLEAMINNGSFKTVDSETVDLGDQKEVYWDGEEPLYLPLYRNSGVKPAPLNYSVHNEVNWEPADIKYFRKIVCDSVGVLKQALQALTSCKIIRAGERIHLNTIIRILCCLGDLIKPHSIYEDAATDSSCLKFTQDIRDILDYLRIRGFPYATQDIISKTQKNEVECMQLNLSICYLYCVYALDTDYSMIHFENKVLEYMLLVFKACNDVNLKSIPLIIKVSRNLMLSKNIVDSCKNGILLGLTQILEVNKLSPNADKLQSFFMDITLNYDFKHLLKKEGMTIWLKSLIGHLRFMMESKVVDRNFLNYVKQICARRYSAFMEDLNSMPSERLLEMLKFDDENFQLTIIHMITSLDVISPDFLQDIAEAIHEESLSLKTSTRLIRLLNTRFLRSNTPSIDQVLFAKFLLNLGCDSFSILDPPTDVEPVPFTDVILESLQSFDCHFEVYPTANYERHLKIFEVCLECLLLYCGSEDVAQAIICFVRTMFVSNTRFPVHSAIAFFELRKKIGYMYNDQHAISMLADLMVSCLMYISCITSDIPKESWSQLAVPELQHSFGVLEVVEILTILESNLYDYGNREYYHTLRIVMFMIRKISFEPEHKNDLYAFLDKLGNYCHESKALDAMWIDICKCV